MPGGSRRYQKPPSNLRGIMESDSDIKLDTETARAVKVKIGILEVVGKKLTTCQELRRFFGDLREGGVGTRAIESKARKMVEEKVAKRLTKVGEIKINKGRNKLRGSEREREGKGGKALTPPQKRDSRVVMDLVNVKIRIIDREERELRKNYHREWNRMEDLVKKNSREWRKLKTSVGEVMERQ